MSVRIQRNSLPLLCLNFKATRYPDYYFRDDFDDEITDPAWTNDPNNGSITEVAEELILAIANGVNGDFWGATENGPVCTIDLTAENVVITAKLNSYTVNDKTRAGLYITDVVSGFNGIHFGRTRRDAAPVRDGLTLLDMNVAELAYVPITTLPIWLRATITGSGVGSTMVFHYSINGKDWIYVYTQPDETWSKVGFLVWNWGLFKAISAPFDFLLIQNPTEEECLAPIDTRAPIRFYHGRIKQMSSLKRAVDDKTGLFQIADMSVTLANADKHYSQKMTSHILKNQEATLYHAWTEEAEVLRLEVIKLIVEDHSMKGPDFIIKLKDITQKYFTMKVPEYICTTDNFPFIHPDHEGRAMPEILGNASLLGDYEYEGAVEAVYVNPTGPTFWCLASAGIITIPTDEVWIGTTQKTEGAHYNVVYQPDVITGVIHTYIEFLAGHEPGDETVSFNTHGYSLAAWNSANGYVQNLAYIIQYYLRYIMGIPASLINSASFATLAGYYVDMGVHENGYLIIQDRADAMEILRQLLFTGGAKGFMALDGRFTVERKNICNWQIASVDQHIFEQIELFGSPHRKWNLTSAINTINVQFGYIPWQNLYTGAKGEYRDNRYERPMEDDIRDREPRQK